MKQQQDKKVSKRKSQVKTACNNCRKKHQGCDNQRPCKRCINTGNADTCKDVPNKRKLRFQTDFTIDNFQTSPKGTIYCLNDLITDTMDGVVVRKIEDEKPSTMISINPDRTNEEWIIHSQSNNSGLSKNEKPNQCKNTLKWINANYEGKIVKKRKIGTTMNEPQSIPPTTVTINEDIQEKIPHNYILPQESQPLLPPGPQPYYFIPREDEEENFDDYFSMVEPNYQVVDQQLIQFPIGPPVKMDGYHENLADSTSLGDPYGQYGLFGTSYDDYLFPDTTSFPTNA